MRELKHLFEKNEQWAADIRRSTPDFFAQLSTQQAPPYLWIGCSDSRVPANQIVGLAPGDVFVHRNIANVVNHSDLNCLSVIQYAVEVLKVKHIIVCGHYGCGGVAGALGSRPLGLIDNWLRHIKDVAEAHSAELDALDDSSRVNRMCELNVTSQVRNVCHTTIVQDAWRRGQPVSVHGWIYALSDGILRDLGVCISGPEQLAAIYRMEKRSLWP